MFHSERAPDFKTVLLASGLVLTLAMGVRHGLGFWLQPISQAHGWTRETFSLAIALQNLMWGVFGPFAGMAADRYGTARVIVFGALLYMGGLLWMALVDQPMLFAVGSGVLIGAALSCTAFGAISGIVGRSAPPEKALAGLRDFIGGRFLRPVRDDAGRATTDFGDRLATGVLLVVRAGGGGDGADGVPPARAEAGAWRQA